MVVIILLFVGRLPRGVGLSLLQFFPSYPSRCGSFFVFLVIFSGIPCCTCVLEKLLSCPIFFGLHTLSSLHLED